MGPTADQLRDGARRAAILRAATTTRAKPIARAYWFWGAASQQAALDRLSAFVRGGGLLAQMRDYLVYEGGKGGWHARVIIQARDHDPIRGLHARLQGGASVIKSREMSQEARMGG